MKPILIGTRGSSLALVQAESIKEQLSQQFPDRPFELQIIKTTGDRILDAPLSKIGDKGLFTREIEQALLDGSIDLAVHSLKDLPTLLPQGLALGAVTRRLDHRDVFISRDGTAFDALPVAAVVATSSMRRRAQILARRPDLRIVDIRGNVNTRLARLESESTINGIILACAGITRLGLLDRVTEIIDDEVIVPAVGQAALGIEIRQDDREIAHIVASLDHQESRAATLCERRFLSRLEGGCQVPIAAHARITGETLHLTGLVASVDGTQMYKGQETGTVAGHLAVGENLARRLLDEGARSILETIYGRSME